MFIIAEITFSKKLIRPELICHLKPVSLACYCDLIRKLKNPAANSFNYETSV